MNKDLIEEREAMDKIFGGDEFAGIGMVLQNLGGNWDMLKREEQL